MTSPVTAVSVDPSLVERLTRAVVATSADSVKTTAPFTDEPLAEIPRSSERDVEQAYVRARAAQPAWLALGVRARAKVLLRFHDLVLTHRDELTDMIQLESGKARLDAFQEVGEVALAARYCGRMAARVLRPKRRVPLAPGVFAVRELHHPMGVVGIVSPWNYPLALAVIDTLPALVAGNTVVHKPDDQGALTALRARELAIEAGVPADAWQVVLGDGPTIGGAVIAGADYVSFTGSTATGRVVARQAGERLIGASLELGGKNPMVVLAGADVAKAADAAVRTSFAAAGQLCTSAERVLVHESLYEEFRERFVARTRELRLGVGVEWGYDVGSIVSRSHLDKVLGHVEDARAHGATVLTGGRARPDIGPLVMEPTVLEGVTPAMRCHGEETFGPVVAIASFRTEDEAVERANDTPYGLLGVVFAPTLREGMRVAARITCGAVSVNEAHTSVWANHDVPLGGMRASGLGRRHGAAGILRYTETQAVVGQRIPALSAPWHQTPEAYAATTTRLLRAVKALGRR